MEGGKGEGRRQSVRHLSHQLGRGGGDVRVIQYRKCRVTIMICNCRFAMCLVLRLHCAPFSCPPLTQIHTLPLPHRKNLDPNYESRNEAPNILFNAATWGLHMGLSSNLRYQVLGGTDRVSDKV